MGRTYTDSDIIEALTRLSIADGGCIRFAGYRNERGYGLFRVNGRTRRVHRLAWELANGPIPEGLFVCHRCDVRDCFRIEHLFLGSAKENTQDMMSKGRNRYVNHQSERTHCKRGHAFDSLNTYVEPSGHRRCRACAALYVTGRRAA